MINTSAIIHFPQYYNQFRIILGVLTKFSFPYIFLVGFLGLITNTTTVLLLSKNYISKNLKNKWTLVALALSDLLFNIALLIRGIHDISRGHSNRLCVVISFLSHLAELLSACYTVSFTIQRYTAVRYPLKAALDRRSSPMISLFIIFLLSSSFCFALTYQTPYIDCYEELHLYWFIVDALSSFLIPFSLILTFNILIVNIIRKHSCSPISVQSTLVREKKQLKNNCRCCTQDETCFTNNNTISNVGNSFIHCDENENISMTMRKEKTTARNGIDQQIFRSSITLPLYQTKFERSSGPRSSQVPYGSSVSSRRSCQHVRLPLHQPLLYRFSSKSSTQSNDDDLAGNMFRRKSQSIRVTRMLVLVSSCFLILNAPAHFCAIAMKIYTTIDSPIATDHIEIDNYQSTDQLIPPNTGTNNETLMSSFEHVMILEDQITPHLFYLAVYITQWIAYASYSLNFFLYSYSGIAFRTSLRRLNKFRRH